jgi:ribonuclease E
MIAEATDEADEADGADAAAPRKRRRRRRSSGAKPPGADNGDTTDEAPAMERGGRQKAKAAGSNAAGAKTTRGSRSPGETKTPATRSARSRATSRDPEATSGPTRTRRVRLGTGRRRREPLPEIIRVTDKSMLITQVGDRDQIVVMEGPKLIEHFVTRSGSRSMVGNVYLGKVQNVLPGMEAAFLDIGRGRNAVLYAGEVSYDEEIEGGGGGPHRIEQALRAGKNVVVQVTKDPIGGKGSRLTQEISLPGRFVVFVPNSQTFGISRRLPDAERQRLKDVLKKIKPNEHGLIVRTAAEGASAEELEADLKYLTQQWADIEKKAKKREKAPRALYEEPDLTIRVIRDHFTDAEYKEIVTDSPAIRDEIVAYLHALSPELAGKVKLHEGPLPLLEEYHVTEQIHKALDRKVWLPSGGYLVIDKAEALTVIDVNTGKHVGKANLEETVTGTNLEAAEEVARQLRLRDIGGIIIIDFIDMLLERNKERVTSTLKNAMAQDKTRSQVFEIGPLGLLEVTRKRVSAGLLESFSETCPTCEGRGLVLTWKV